MITDRVSLHVLVKDSTKAFFLFVDLNNFFFSIPGALSIPLNTSITMFCVDWFEFLAHRTSAWIYIYSIGTCTEFLLHFFISGFYPDIGALWFALATGIAFQLPKSCAGSDSVCALLPGLVLQVYRVLVWNVFVVHFIVHNTSSSLSTRSFASLTYPACR